MYKTFNEYQENKAIDDFNDKFNLLCENVVNSGTDINDYLTDYALPAILEGNYEDEDQLLEALGDWFKKKFVLYPPGESAPPSEKEYRQQLGAKKRETGRGEPQFKTGRGELARKGINLVKAGILEYLNRLMQKSDDKSVTSAAKAFINLISKRYKPEFKHPPKDPYAPQFKGPTPRTPAAAQERPAVPEPLTTQTQFVTR